MRVFARVAFRSPLASWFPDARALSGFRRRRRGGAPGMFRPRDRGWRGTVPAFGGAVELIGRGLPFQVVAARRYDRAGDPRRLGGALYAGETVFVPQVHQVLPRVARLMVAFRVGLLGLPGLPVEACSFLFLVAGRGRPGMGLHHDGDVDALWLQLEGRRTVTLGPPVRAGTPADLDARLAGGARAGWWTGDLAPGTLLYLPPRTPHAVVCRGHSLALSLTWRRPQRSGTARPGAPRVGVPAWQVVSGYATEIPPRARRTLWTQMPTVAGPVDPARRAFPLWLPDGTAHWLPPGLRGLAGRLATMPRLTWSGRAPVDPAVRLLEAAGVLASRDLPQGIVPDDPRALDGWEFR